LARKRNQRQTLKVLSISILSVMTGMVFLLVTLTYLGTFGPVPGLGELRSLQNSRPTVFYSSDGIEIGTYTNQKKRLTDLDDINPFMIDALIAIEDVRFYSHSGIDNRALARVLVKTILLGRDTGGGSTITQQLAKNLFPRENNRGFFLITEKIREMIIASRMEALFTKKEILALYLNTVSFGEDTFGVEMASNRFFSKPASDLELEEAAVLAGLLKATTSYNPHRNPERSEQRRNLVLSQMEKYELISEVEAERSISSPLVTNYSRINDNGDMAPYFGDVVKRELDKLMPALTKPDGSSYNPVSDGLQVYTTLDSRIQQAADSSVARRLKELQAILDRETEQRPIFGEEDPDVLNAWKKSGHYRELVSQGLSEDEINEVLHTPVPTSLFTWEGYKETTLSPYDETRYYLSFLNAGFVAIHPNTGHVLAWTGGIDYRHFKYDQVTARRQPGSAFKPILYASALENGRSPCDYQRNMLATYADYDDWTPRNHEEEYGGRYSLQAALAQSINTVAVHVAMETGVRNIQETASAMGIKSHMPEAPSIALGTAEVSLLELTAAYTSFLNEGRPVSPVFINEIRTAGGEVIYSSEDEAEDAEPEYRDFTEELNPEEEYVQAENPDMSGISPETAAAMLRILEKAVNEGTGQPLRTQFGIRHALGGKTGTTQQFSDGWFVGFTPDMVFGTRIGGSNNRVRFREFPAYASQTALPVTGHFLNELALAGSLTPQTEQFPDYLTETSLSMNCPDFQNDRFRDRVRDFFTGRSSDEPRVIGGEEEQADSTQKKGGFFRRLGRALGL
jgi:penicillin-binding protein 1A